MSKVVSFINLKGGVGKTALAVNFADWCAKTGYKTLLVDLDPQTNATFSTMGVDGWDSHKDARGTVADVLGAREHTSAEGKRKEIPDVIATGLLNGFDLVPSHLELFTIDLDLAGKPNREGRLKKALSSVQDSYDIIVCDCPPNLTIPTQNAITASSHYVVPVSPDFLSAIGIALLKTRIAEFCNELDHSIALAGIALSRVGRPARLRSETIGSIRSQFGKDVLKVEIKERVSVAAAAESAISIYGGSDGQASFEFEAASKQILQRMGF